MGDRVTLTRSAMFKITTGYSVSIAKISLGISPYLLEEIGQSSKSDLTTCMQNAKLFFCIAFDS